MFEIGQQVVCIAERHDFNPEKTLNRPEKGRVYTIRGFEAHPEAAGEYIHLEEIVNPTFEWHGLMLETSFRIGCFRPVRKNRHRRLHADARAGHAKKLEPACGG